MKRTLKSKRLLSYTNIFRNVLLLYFYHQTDDKSRILYVFQYFRGDVHDRTQTMFRTGNAHIVQRRCFEKHSRKIKTYWKNPFWPGSLHKGLEEKRHQIININQWKNMWINLRKLCLVKRIEAMTIKTTCITGSWTFHH